MEISSALINWVSKLGTGSLISHVVGIGVALWSLANYRLIIAIIRTLPRDFKAFFRLVKLFAALRYYQRNNITVSKAFDEIVRKNPKKVILYYEDQEWTAEQIQSLSNKMANYFQEQGYKKGDVVAIFMENKVEYLSIWLGLSKIGVIASLINYNLRLQPLKHVFEAVTCKGIIYNAELTPALEEVIALGGLVKTSLYCLGNVGNAPLTNNAVDVLVALDKISDTQPIVKDKIGFDDKIFYIYTSGTTGLPKAAVIKHSRFTFAAIANFYMHGLREDDITYTSLPLYHSAGIMLGGGCALMKGVSMVIRKKFSASNFWKDCVRYNVTTAQYIGEIMRYLMAQPPSPLDKSHKVRLMFGNGLRAELWPHFVKRFNIPQINELYGATEGNCNMVNISNQVGAVGFVPRYAKFLIPIQLIKVDEDTGNPIRDNKTGFAIKCQPNEPGELIGRIQRNHPIRDYEGYADKSSSKNKVLDNAFKKGDAWFRSGDILVMDEMGYFYFRDRGGDTFRWKGENCSTAEVESVISNVCGLKDAVVFGVEVPESEGRAGMAVICDPDGSLDLAQFATGICKVLPSYARPLFIRVCTKIAMTGTYKLKKLDYQKEGYDVTKVEDKIYFLQGSKYTLMDDTLLHNIKTGKIRV